MAESTEIKRLRRHVIVVADEAEREAMAKRGKRAVPKGIDVLAILTPLEAVQNREQPVDSFELTDAAEAADYFADARDALEWGKASTAAGMR